MNTETGKPERAKHRILMQDRENLEVHGVTDVIRFDEQSVTLNTQSGMLGIEGDALHIHVLSTDQGVVTLDGRIDSLCYYEEPGTDRGEKTGFFGRIFR